MKTRPKEPWQMTREEYRASLTVLSCLWSERDWLTGVITGGKFRVVEATGCTRPATGETPEEAIESVVARHRQMVLDYRADHKVPAEVLAEYGL